MNRKLTVPYCNSVQTKKLVVKLKVIAENDIKIQKCKSKVCNICEPVMWFLQ
jgi:hypothetical protein